METKKKILIAIIAIIIIAGCVVVGVKGFNVSLYLREHDTLEYTFDQKFNKDDIKSIAKEVLGNKKFEVRTVEVFDDSVYIISESITEEERQAILEKLVALYQEPVTEEQTSDNTEATEQDSDDTTETTSNKTVEDLVEGTDYKVYHDAKVRLRDLLKPYILPTLISAIIIIICMIIRYKILNTGKVIKNTAKVIGKSFILLLVLLSLVAILRIPVSTWILPGMMFFVLIYLVINFEIEIRRKDEKAN